MSFLAHIDRDTQREQSVEEHLRGTAELASGFAADFSACEAAYRCALLHDIGKYSSLFQTRIRGADIFVDHSTAGALEAFALRDTAAAFCIAGHHGGLPDRGSKTDDESASTLLGRMQRKAGVDIEDYSEYKREIALPDTADSPTKDFLSCAESAFFYTHMLYSCLVDADWLDTERFMSAGTVQRGTGLPLTELFAKLDEYVSKWWSAKDELNLRRCAILRELIEGGSQPSGLFSLTAPTGSGKTVASVAFALRHALKNSMRRIIYVIPYTSIIEQTASVFEKIFGSESVVAHYADVSYDVMTPSAARGLLEAVYWHPGMRWIIDAIYVLKPIRFSNVRRNEVDATVSKDDAKKLMTGSGGKGYIAASEHIAQRAAMVLRDVRYVIEAHFVMTDNAADGDNEGKFCDIMRRRLEKGQCYHQPCFGVREFPACFRAWDGGAITTAYPDESRDLGLMLFDIDYSDPKNITPMFFRARLENGVLRVPPPESSEVLR